MIRLCPERPLPPYSYVPGRFPHPLSDPAGHSFQTHKTPPETHHPDLSPPLSLISDWKSAPDYLFGIDLFNYGFYWESHETWERLWIAFGRSGRDADFVKGLIKLAAAGVKAREGRSAGIARHACRAGELFRQVSQDPAGNCALLRFGGLELQALCDAADGIAADAIRIVEHSADLLTTTLPLVLSPTDANEE